MHRFVRNIWILLVSRALVIFAAMRLPVSQTHPAKVRFAVNALHVIASAILLYADVTFGAVFCVGTDVVRRFAVVCTFGEPLFDYLAVGWGMVIHSAAEAELGVTGLTVGFLWADVLASDY